MRRLLIAIALLTFIFIPISYLVLALLPASFLPNINRQGIRQDELEELVMQTNDYWEKTYKKVPTPEEIARLDALQKDVSDVEMTTQTPSPAEMEYEKTSANVYQKRIEWGNTPGFTSETQTILRNYYPKNDAKLRYESEQAALGMNDLMQGTQTPSFLLSRNLYIRGMYAISQGKHAEAVEWFNRSVRVGIKQCREGNFLYQLNGIATQHLGLTGYQNLLWSEPSPEALELALQGLNQIEKDILLTHETLLDAIYVERINGLAHFLEDPVKKNARIKYNLLSALGMGNDPLHSASSEKEAYGNLAPGMKKYFRENFWVYRRGGVAPFRQLQWTFYPAFEKRLDVLWKENPELFNTHILGKEETGKLSPTLRSLFCTLFNESNLLEMKIRVKTMCENYQQTRVALATRLFNLRNGRNPKSVEELVPEYLAAVPCSEFSSTSATLQLREVSEPMIVVNQLAQRVFGNNTNVQIGTITVGPLGYRDAQPVSILFGIPTGSDNYERIVAGFRGFPTLVQNVVYTPWQEGDQKQATAKMWKSPGIGDPQMDKFLVTCKPLLQPLAVVSPGPSEQPPATPLISYDATNGTRSAGSIITFIHF